jgi:hypothetical protein
VGRTLATARAAAGHQVLAGSRTPDKEPPPAGTAVTDPVAAIDRPVYAGAGPAALAAVDSVAGLWFALALGRGHGRRLAFRVLTDSGSL